MSLIEQLAIGHHADRPEAWTGKVQEAYEMLCIAARERIDELTGERSTSPSAAVSIARDANGSLVCTRSPRKTAGGSLGSGPGSLTDTRLGNSPPSPAIPSGLEEPAEPQPVLSRSQCVSNLLVLALTLPRIRRTLQPVRQDRRRGVQPSIPRHFPVCASSSVSYAKRVSSE